VKNTTTCDFDGDGRALASGGLPDKKNCFAIFSGFFWFILCRVFIFAECFLALGKVLFVDQNFAV
jgi:hypothetical protein